MICFNDVTIRTPFKENGGIGKVDQLFGEELWGVLEELNEVLAA